jgi:hypothetical protein
MTFDITLFSPTLAEIMKKDTLMLLVLVGVAFVALWIAFCLGERFAQLKLAQDSSNAVINNHEARLNSLECDFHRRQKFRIGFSKALGWLLDKVHL